MSKLLGELLQYGRTCTGLEGIDVKAQKVSLAPKGANLAWSAFSEAR
jgi:hypothetical protein